MLHSGLVLPTSIFARCSSLSLFLLSASLCVFLSMFATSVFSNIWSECGAVQVVICIDLQCELSVGYVAPVLCTDMSQCVSICRIAEFLNTAEDLELDIPKIWDNASEVFASLLQDFKVLPLRFLQPCLQPLVKLGNGKEAMLVQKTLKMAAEYKVSCQTVAFCAHFWACFWSFTLTRFYIHLCVRSGLKYKAWEVAPQLWLSIILKTKWK